MSRSAWKSYIFSKNIRKNLTIDIFVKRKSFSYFLYRYEPILPYFSNFNFKIHSGKKIKKIRSNEFLICKKAGEFSFSRKPYFFPIKKK